MTWLLFARRVLAAVGRWLARDPLQGAVVFLLVVLGLLLGALHRADARARAEHLAALNASARADTTQAVAGVDSAVLTAVTRQAEQAQLRGDSLAKRLHLVEAARVQLLARVRALDDSAPATAVTHVGNGRLLTFDLRHVPYTAHADVAVPDDTAQPPSIRLAVGLDSAALEASVGCVGDTARVLFTAPAWLPVAVTQATQDPRVCRTVRAPAPAPDRFRRWDARLGPAVVVDAHGAAHAGPGVTAGWAPVRGLVLGPTALVDPHGHEHHGVGFAGGWSPF